VDTLFDKLVLKVDVQLFKCTVNVGILQKKSLRKAGYFWISDQI
jgi:hypothetical protein